MKMTKTSLQFWERGRKDAISVVRDAVFFASVTLGKGAFEAVEVDGIELPSLTREEDVLVPLPGWIWKKAESQEKVVLRAEAPGRSGRGSLSRAELLGWVEELAALPETETQVYAIVSALEHVHHGAFWPELTPATRAWLMDAARDLGLEDEVPADLAISDISEAVEEHDQANPVLRRFGRAVRADETADPLAVLAAELDKVILTADQRLTIAIDLTPHFCRIDQVEGLYQAVLPDDGPFAIRPEPHRAWADSLTLPARFLSEDYDCVLRILQELNTTPEKWASTPAVAWVLMRLVDQVSPFVPFHLFEGILDAGLQNMRLRAGFGRGGVHCAALRRAAVHLLERRWLCSDRLQIQLVTVLGEAFGASAEFWAELDQRQIDLPGPLLQVKQRFTALLTAEKVDDLAVFQGQWVAGFDRLHLERWGHPSPAGAALSAAPGALLRHLAAPFADPPQAEDSDALGRAIRWAYSGPEQNPMTATQHQVMEQAVAMLDDAAARPDAPDAPQIAHMAAGLTRLAGLASGGLGLGLTLGLTQALLAGGARAWADSVSGVMEPVFRRVVQNAGAGLLTETALVTAAASASTSAGASPSPAASPGLSGSQAEAITRLLDTLPEGMAGHGPGAADAWPHGPHTGALFDTVVAVYSCQAHLDTRIPAIRATWLADLQRLGIPYVIVVGGAHTGLNGDVLTVAAGDSYEDLPRKTLAMIDWVRTQTGAGHLLKVDDDCYLDVRAYFLDPTYRQHDYYGRRLEKRGALVERTWHQTRSQTAHARLSFEKLPRDAVYADGGTGYSLTRQAMQAIAAQVASPQGQALVHAAWSEDKLVGALLAQAGIAPAETSYYTAVERRAGPDGPAVPQWVSGVHPSALEVTKLLHLDAGGDMRAVHAAKSSPRLAPPRIWPTHRAPRMGFNSGALHLLSPPARLRAVADADLAVVCVLRNEAQMLPHFLRHYRAMGVTGFLMADNGSDDGTLAYLSEQPDVALFSADTEFREMDQGTDWKIALMAHYRTNRWSVVADADELLLYPGYETTPLPDWLQSACAPGEDAVVTRMLDLYPQGPLAQASLTAADLFQMAPYTDRQPFLSDSLSLGPFENAPTWTSGVRHRLMPGARPDLFVAQKVAILRYQPSMQFSTSLHYAADVTRTRQMLLFAHFKYHAGFAEKAQREIIRGQYYNGAEEYRRYLQMLAQGQDRLFDPDHSIHWRDCQPVKALLGSAH